MGRGKRGFLDRLAAAPWPIGLVVGVAGFVLIRYGVPAWLAGQSEAFARAFASGNPAAPLAWIFLGLCLLASVASFAGAQQRRRLLDTRTGLESVAALGWRDFERLVGEAFRRQGYAVEETGLGGADGGIDLVLRREGRCVLVQCKQWRRTRVQVNVVREMYGLLAHHGADEVRIAALGGFTPDAARFAQGKPIQLIDGATLLGMIRAVQAGSRERPHRLPEASVPERASPRPAVPVCPRCGAGMVLRKNRNTGAPFWGCARYPACRGLRDSDHGAG